MIPTSLSACRFSLLPAVAALVACGVFASHVRAQQVLYWDPNGPTAGSSGGATAAGAWEGANWSTSPAGTSATQAWPTSYTYPWPIAAFSAGANATGSYTVTVNNIYRASGLSFNLGNVTVSGSGNVSHMIVATPAGNNIFPIYTAPGTSATVRNTRLPDTLGSNPGTYTLNKTGSGNLTFDSMIAFSCGLLRCSEGTTTISNTHEGLASATRIEVGTAGTATLSLQNASFKPDRMAAAGQNVVLGVNPGSSGTLNVSGGTTYARGDWVIGNGGTGTLDISGDLRAQAGLDIARRPARFILGLQPGSSGTMNLPAGSYCEVFGSNGISRGAGAGVLNLAGGLLTVGRDVNLVPFSTTVPIVLSGSSEVRTMPYTGTFAGPISGSGSLTTSGGGTMQITGATSYTGDTIINTAGLTVTGIGASIGTAANTTHRILNNGTLTVSAGAKARTTTSVQIGTGGGTGAAVVTDYGYLDAGSYIEVGSSSNGTLTISDGGWVNSTTSIALGVSPGSVTGTINVTGKESKLRVGTTLILGYQSAAVCTVGDDGTITAGNIVLGELSGGSGAFVLNQGGTLKVGGANGISRGAGESGFYLNGGTLKVTGSSLTTTVPMTLTNDTFIDTSGVDCVLGGLLGGTGGLTKTGGGILYLNAANSYTGGTTQNAGQIVVAAASSLGTGPVDITDGNIHSTSTFSRDTAVAVAGASSSLTAADYMEIGVGGSGTVVVTDGAQVSTPSSMAFGVLGGGTQGYADVSGSGSALNCGTTLYLGYLSSGTVNVGTGGSVTVGGQLLLAAGAASQGYFNLNAGGTLNVGGANGIAKGDGTAGFNLSGGLLKVIGSSLTSSVPMTLLSQTTTVDTSGVEATLSGVLTGSGHLAKTGAGTLYLTAANSRSGDTTVWAGTLSAATAVSLSTRNLALTGGTLDLAFSGTATVQTLSFDGAIQFGGTWGSLASSATNKTSRITGSGLLQVLSAVPPVVFNEAANAGLRTTGGSGSLDLLAATGVSPAGGTFSGPGVTGNSFDPIIAGYGIHTITYSASTSSGTFTISVTGGLTLDEEGRSMAPQNYSLLGGIAFAKDALNHPSHTIAHLNDGNYGNSFSWIGDSAGSFAGINLNRPAQPINRIAFGRDNTGAFTDRCLDFYLIQYTTVHPPDASTTAWTTIGAVDYRSVNPGITQPGLRHVFSFPAVLATGIRIVTTDANTAIDEIEVYPASGIFLTNGITLVGEGGSIAHGNLSSTGTAFAKDEIGTAPHATAGINNGTFGNASSWIGGTANSFTGINLGGSTTLDRIAFGRDNTGAFTDRTLGRYTLQYTTVADPDNTTPDGSWINIGLLDYQSSTIEPLFNSPSLRHELTFPAVTATGIRLIAPEGAAIDELELYLTAPHLKLEQPAGTSIANGGTADFGERFPDDPTPKTFTITNDGTGTLTLGTLTIDGTAGDFTAGSISASTLVPGASATFTITFNVGPAGIHNASAHLASDDPAATFDFTLAGTSLVPTFNAATNDGLIVDTANGAVDLPTVTAATPAGGTFSGPGVTGPTGASFDPAAAGFGYHTLTCSYGGAASTFRISVIGGLTLVTEGGTFAAGNFAPGGTAFASDVIDGYEAHTIPHLNDENPGNDYSWIGDSDNTFAGISLGATPVPVNRIAFGRDNTGVFTDRSVDHYIIQYTTTPDPDAATTAWTSLGAVDYRSPAITNPALRHLFSFPTVSATGLRIITATAGTCIDEFEIYTPYTPQELWRHQYFGSASDTGEAADSFDADNDGLTNLAEYGFGSNPTRPGSAFLPEPVNNGTTVTYRFTQPEGVSGINYTAEWSTSLAPEAWTAIPDTGTAPQHLFTVPIPGGTARLFTRVVVTAP